MFRNRTIQIGLGEKKVDQMVDTDAYADKVTIAAACVEGIIEKVGIAVATYIALDTVRKVILIKAGQK